MNIQLNKILLFFSLQIKAAFRMIPVILATTACFASITWLAAFAGTKLLYSGRPATKNRLTLRLCFLKTATDTRAQHFHS